MTDSFTLDVVAAGLDAAATEMFDVLRKTAMSPIIYEVLDVGTGITDATGALVSSGAGIPSFVGVLDKSVCAIIEKTGDRIAAGDIYLTNDPNHGGVTHLNDIVVAEPVFWNGCCVAWVASIAHWGDVGGCTPGSMSTDTSELVAEGLRLPIVKLFEQGQRNNAIFDIVLANSRLPDFVNGDLWAQISAGRRAADIIRELCNRHGSNTLNKAIADARTTGEKRAYAGLKSLPNGVFTINEPQDDGSTWFASITISNNRFVVDLRDAPEESPGPYNTSREGTLVACQVFFKALTDADRFANAGCQQGILRLYSEPSSPAGIRTQTGATPWWNHKWVGGALPDHVPVKTRCSRLIMETHSIARLKSPKRAMVLKSSKKQWSSGQRKPMNTPAARGLSCVTGSVIKRCFPQVTLMPGHPFGLTKRPNQAVVIS